MAKKFCVFLEFQDEVAPQEALKFLQSHLDVLTVKVSVVADANYYTLAPLLQTPPALTCGVPLAVTAAYTTAPPPTVPAAGNCVIEGPVTFKDPEFINAFPVDGSVKVFKC